VVNRREKTIAIILAAALGAWLADQYVIEPYIEQFRDLQKQTQTRGGELDKANRLLANNDRVTKNWKEQLAGGLSSDPAAAEAQALHAIRDFAQNSRVGLVSLKPDRTGRLRSADEGATDFMQIRLQATGTGTTSAIANLLWQIESSSLPLKINDVRINSRKDGADDLSFALNVSTIYFSLAPESNKGSQRSAAPKGESK
jgi:Type II secretion system (T2SS), protein M subtype b